jgi:uncharacterized Zn finger protein
MDMTLSDFERFIDEKVVERGLSYIENGQISQVEKIGEEEFSAAAFGSSVYDVYVRIDGRRIVEHSCTCPYDWGHTCKHEVAVFYKIRNGDFVDTGEKLERILDSLSENDLRRFVFDLAKKDRRFRRNFLREFDEDYIELEDDDYREFDEDYY